MRSRCWTKPFRRCHPPDAGRRFVSDHRVSTAGFCRPPSHSDDKRSLYARYLNWTFAFREPNELTEKWLRGLALKHPAGAAAQPDPEILHTLDNRKASIESVTSSLERFIRPLHTAENTKDFAQGQIAAHKVGTKALWWLLSSGLYHQSDLLLHPKFFKLLVHALVAELRGNRIYDLLLLDEPPALLASEGKKQLQTRRGDTLQDAVRAIAFWAPDSESVNRSYACWLGAHNTSLPGRKQLGLGIPLSRAYFPLKSLFLSTNSSCVHTSVFNGLVEFLERVEPDSFEMSFEKSRLYLHHPVKANADLALDILGRAANATTRTASMSRKFAVNGERSGAMIFLYFVRTAQVLAKEERMGDARWVLDFGHTRRPEPFAKSANPYRGRGESAHRRLATERERFIGVAMDEDGYVIREDNEKYSQVRKTARPSPHENDTTKAPGQQRGIEAPSN